jgi:predicted dehydrogenase
MSTMTNKIKIGIIGCGAVVEKLHLPILKKIKNVKIQALVDKDLNRIKQLQNQYQVPIIHDNYRQILSDINIALVALPNYLHAPISIELLTKGIHVFCEKPMATNSLEAEDMVKAAKQSNRYLSIGMVKRHFAINQKIKQLLSSDYLGKIKSFEYEEGVPFDWPLRSTYAFDKQMAGGGILIDMGAHVIDLIIWLLGKPTNINYQDDSRGGVEANCQISLNDINGRIELSRDRTLKNTFKIFGQKGILETSTRRLNSLSVQKGNHQETFTTQETFEDCIFKELSSFIHAATYHSRPPAPGEEIIESIKLINYCYSHKQQLYEPWYSTK